MRRRTPGLPVRWPVLVGLVVAGVVRGLGTAWLSLKYASAFGVASVDDRGRPLRCEPI